MRLHKTGHPIADTISDLIGDLPDGDYKIAYGILRHNLFTHGHWFEVDRALWGASHYDGLYRISYRGTQPKYVDNFPAKPHGLKLSPWKLDGEYDLICPPTDHVCEFFNIDYSQWLMNAIRQADKAYVIRTKGTSEPIEWAKVKRLITFNSSIAIQALQHGVPVISDPVHSTIGSYTSHIESIYNYDRSVILDFISSHQFKLGDKEAIWGIIKYYLSSSDGTPEKQ